MPDARLSLSVAASFFAIACGATDPHAETRDFSPRAPASAPLATPRRSIADAWLPRVIYLAIPDRFFNGDPTNDDAGDASCSGPSPTLFHGGDLAGLRRKIPYLQDLGVTAVWITPLYAQTAIKNGSCGYHGYWANFNDPDDGAMEPKLGTIADARALVQDLHAAGMKLIVDMVVNHAGRNANLVYEHRDWFHDAETCATLGDPMIFCPLSGLPDFAQENPAVATYLTTSSRKWVEHVMPDGIRMDTARHVPPAYFATSWMPAVRGVKPDLFTVAEVFDEGPYTHFKPVLDAGFDSTFDFPLRRALVDAFAKGRSVDAVAEKTADAFATLGHDRALLKTTFLDNHDTPRFLSEAPEGVTPEELAARYALALTALFTLPGIPQVYSGDELGMIGKYPDNRRDMPSWAWDDATRAGAHGAGYVPNPGAAYDLVKALAKLRRENPALAKGRYVELLRQNGAGPNTLAFLRADGDSRVLVILHDDDAPSGALAIPFRANARIPELDKAAWPDGTVLDDLVHAGAPPSITVRGGKIEASFDKKSAGVYRVRR